jgi:nitrate reductase assembly molybdenum cofactor insertion protein NarJ
MSIQPNEAVPRAPFGQQCWDLLSDAAEWRLISLLLSSPRGDWRSQVLALETEVRDESLQEAAQVAQPEAEQGMYDSTFGPGGPASPREVTYRPASLSSEFLAELAGHYQAFGYVPPYDEPADHVAVETDFIAYLKLKEAFAVSRGDAEQAATARDAAERVAGEHLAYLAGQLAERLAASGIRYLSLASAALLERTGSLSSTTSQELPVLTDIVGDQEGWACCDGESLDGDDLEIF